ncbi:uncharacterized protein BDW70DRAFT_126951 [Aspergillus foveolatus]|uniref:uncharacterized protein n=1 Tax=Aspergillus foveolatus TaxID=210207 RepID=UPI003CCDF475
MGNSTFFPGGRRCRVYGAIFCVSVITVGKARVSALSSPSMATPHLYSPMPLEPLLSSHPSPSLRECELVP